MRHGRTLAAKPRSTIHTSPGWTLAIFCLHGVEEQKTLVGTPVAVSQHLCFPLHCKDALDNFTPLPMRETWKLSNNRGFTHAQAVSPWLWSLPYAGRAQRTRTYMPESLADSVFPCSLFSASH